MNQVEINWNNIFTLGLVLLAFYIVVKSHESIGRFLAKIGDVSPHQPANEQLYGMTAFALLVILIVGIIRVLTQK